MRFTGGNKNKAKKITIDGILFDSLGEGAYYVILKARCDRGEITDLECHPHYPIEVNGKKIGRGAKMDFAFSEGGKRHIIDFKGRLEGDTMKLWPTHRDLVEALYKVKPVAVTLPRCDIDRILQGAKIERRVK